MSPILTVQSLLDHPSSSGRVRVCSRKHGQPCLTKAAAFDYAADGIRINAIAADQIDTPLIATGPSTRGDGGENRATPARTDRATKRDRRRRGLALL